MECALFFSHYQKFIAMSLEGIPPEKIVQIQQFLRYGLKQALIFPYLEWSGKMERALIFFHSMKSPLH